MLSVTIEREAVVRFGERFGVTFQRTLRVPDDGRVYNLPPGLGAFPLLKVEDYADRVPDDWRERGGIFLPLYQREALWLGFQAEDWKPNAVKVGVGGVNAVTGERWDAAFSDQGQDYLVCPPQLWLDGIKSGSGRIRQFVAAPLGQGFTVESQLTGEDIFGGIQIAVFEPRPGLFPDEPPPVPEFEGPLRAAGLGAPPGAQMSPAKLGIAAGGAIEQKIYPDPHGPATWDPENYGVIWVHIVNSEQYREITGRRPPRTPITAKSYTSHGLPWFALYDERAGDIATSERLSRVRSVRQIEAERGARPNPEDAPVEVSEGQVIRLHSEKKTSGRAKSERQAQAGRKKERKRKPRRKL